MRKLLFAIACLMFVTLETYAADCNFTQWRKGGTCAQAGLDTHNGVCLPGNLYETLCDDSPGHIRTCEGPRRCYNDYEDNYDRACDWDFNTNDYCRAGYINMDCRNGCDTRIRRFW